MPPPLRIPRPVWMLGWVSFLTDLASEAIYPLLPVFLSAVLGAGAMAIGVIEGVAEAAASVLRIVSGRLSDRWRVRKPLVLAGYALSSVVRPLIGTATVWSHVLALRFVDRVGKGVRGAPRDAMLAQLAPDGARGRVFGLNRAMDHAGAIAGPLAASAFLWFHPGEYRALFLLTILPGIAVIVLLSRVPEVVASDTHARAPARLDGKAGPEAEPSWRRLPRSFVRLQAVILLFALGNSTDAFLLLRLGDAGVPPAGIPLLWAAIHVVKSAASVPGGALADRLGRRQVIAAGWLLYALVYAGFAATDTPGMLIALFLAYGLYFGLSESAERALVADLAPSDLRATAFGVYNAVLGFGSLLASLAFGLIWATFGAPAAFLTGATLALAASLALFAAIRT